MIKNKVSKNLAGGGGVTDFFFCWGGGGGVSPQNGPAGNPDTFVRGIWRQSKKGSWKGWTVW